MSSETDQPRQRTVAELLAAHGEANATGRRRRRRAEEPDEAAPPAYSAPAADAPDWHSAPPREPSRRSTRDSQPLAQREPGRRRRAGDEPAWDPAPQDSARPARQAPAHPDAEPWDSAPWASAQQVQQGAGRRDPEEWDADQWDDDPWDSDTRESDPRGNGAWDAQPPQPPQASWDDRREPRYPGPPPSRERARRREPDEWESREAPSANWDRAPHDGERRPPREAPSWDSRAPEPEIPSREAPSWDPAPPEPPPHRRAAGPVRGDRPPVEPVPTEQMPYVHRTLAGDTARTTRIQQRRRAEPDVDETELGDDDGGPATMVGAAPAGAEAWHRARTEDRRRPPEAELPEDDGGPPTAVGAAPPGAEAWHRARTDGPRRGGNGMPPPAPAPVPPAFDDEDAVDGVARDYPAGLDRRSFEEEPTGFFSREDDELEAPGGRRPGKEASDEQASGPAWPAVIAQWIAGAIGGAALWVGFRFLWRDLPVVALAAAVLVTVGLVVVVRALLRSNDLRTTLFAVLVGLLLTVSPAILVLLGR